MTSEPRMASGIGTPDQPPFVIFAAANFRQMCRCKIETAANEHICGCIHTFIKDLAKCTEHTTSLIFPIESVVRPQKQTRCVFSVYFSLISL